MSNLQRYALMDQPAEMDPDDAGEWVRYEDAMAAVRHEQKLLRGYMDWILCYEGTTFVEDAKAYKLGISEEECSELRQLSVELYAKRDAGAEGGKA